MQFKVTGTTKDLFGDGFAIWYARDRMQSGEVFGSKDYFSGLAVLADTYSNHNGPHNVRSHDSRKAILFHFAGGGGNAPFIQHTAQTMEYRDVFLCSTNIHISRQW